MTEQAQHLQRVAATTKEAILTFINARLNSADPRFTADALRNYVMNNVVGGVSPGSSDRILRMLRQTGKISYVVLNRGKSLYEARSLGKPLEDLVPTREIKGYTIQVTVGNDWIASRNAGLCDKVFATKESAQAAITEHGSTGATYRVVDA